ncbi:uncharacterized protein LOC124315386 isoform X2 [Daphnia pulicaria]|uniref:uncharacterized protein LOC124315386 isoform X2 n=1 Tax=Daphnia pulicaria TaxID=35523 RepID=UPI001EEBCCB6|nr:uncharacterized protein LOC124315386 isoform X2 [Daphnia pulicaria]
MMSSDMSFQRSLQPMLVWMRFIGVFLESPGTSPAAEAASPWIRIGITCYGFLFFFGNVFFNGLNITEFFAFFEITSTASLWTMAISILNMAATTICCQLSLMSSAATKWPNLMQMLCQMKSQGFFETRDYQNFRRIFLGGLTFIMVFAVTTGTGLIAPYLTLDWEGLKASFPRFCLLFVFSGGALFSSLGWMASNMLDILARQVHQTTSEKTELNWTQRIDTWRRQYHLISQFVDEISHCYGPLVLTLITSGFVVMIDLSYNIMQYVIDNCHDCIVNHILLFITQFSFFLVLIYVPHRIRESAITFSKQLQCIEQGPEKDDKIDIFALSVLNSLPKITAIGVFDVDLHLVPTLIGTTLTYLIILGQFQFTKTGECHSSGQV